MDQAAPKARADETRRDVAEALDVASELGASVPFLHPAILEALALWRPDLPPATVLLGDLGLAFAAGFHTLSGEDRAKVALIVERAMLSASEYVRTAASTGFLEAAIHWAEANGTWPAVQAVLLPFSRAFAQAYRSDAFFRLPPSQDVATSVAPGMGT